LGAHVVGLIARRIKDRSWGSFMISRVTALDPAGPFLTYALTSWIFPHIEKTDGKKFKNNYRCKCNSVNYFYMIFQLSSLTSFTQTQVDLAATGKLDTLVR
jgi:hypothetical protein